MNQSIWILEDDPGVAFVYQDLLESRYNVLIFKTLPSLVDALKTQSLLPDLLISDLLVQDQTFLDFLNSDDSLNLLTMPFIVVSGVDDADSLRQCYDEGALEYMTKPFRKNELLVKVERLLDQRRKSVPPVMTFKGHEGKISVDPIGRSISLGNGAKVTLTSKQLQIFSALEKTLNGRDFVIRQELERAVWGETVVTEKTLDVHMFHLRQKIKEIGLFVKLNPEKGYYLVETDV